ncbi:MAG TPA: sulfatase-like hydrolase/transferase [Acidobacteriota bacterium]|jgi:arylsulfatase A-like enzyme|nr:sulfatase-like hydrolase/transferase [Acidobacteriota bacterium]
MKAPRNCQKCLILIVIACFAALLQIPGRAGAQPPRRPNILFLMADEYRRDALGVAGHTIVKTPNLDRLARQGIRFTRAYTASPVCSPARATLFTGRYAHIHGVVRNDLPLNPGEVALPELLKRYGYVTGIVGKLHLPPDGWFDTKLIVTRGRGDVYAEFLKRALPGFRGHPENEAVPGTLIGPPRTSLRIGTSVLPENLYEEAFEADRAIDFLKLRKGSDRPWFLFLSMLKPHSEFVIPEPYATMYRPADMPLPATFHAGAKMPVDIETRAEDKNQQMRKYITDPELLRAVIAHYYGAVTMVDKQMGRVLDELENLGMSDNTIVVFTADHGNMLGERNHMFKGVMYEASAGVPLLLRAPGKLPQGKVVNAVLDNTAVMPTLLDLAGLPVPAGIQGKSLAPLVRGDASGWPGMAFSVLHDRMVCSGDWKLIEPLSNRDRVKPELYNLIKDRDEQKNLYGKPEAAKVQRKLQDALEQWWKQKPPAVNLPASPAR